MTVTTVNYPAVANGSSNWWTNPTNAQGAADGVYASESGSQTDPAGALIASGLSLSSLGTITKVRIGVTGKGQSYQSQYHTVHLVPWFGGTTAGTDNEGILYYASATTLMWDITSDPVGPGAANWTAAILNAMTLHAIDTNTMGGLWIDCFILEVTHDDAPVPLTVTINKASGQADPASESPVNFTVVFSETVTDFATGDVTISGTAGATTATVTGSGTTYNVEVSGMTGNGTVVATIAAGVATSSGGATNSASTSTDNSVAYDGLTTIVIPYTSGTATAGVTNAANAFGEAADDLCASFSTPSSAEYLLTNAVGTLGRSGLPMTIEIGRRIRHESGTGQGELSFYIGGTYLGGGTQSENSLTLAWLYFPVSHYYTPSRGYWTWSDVEQLTVKYSVPGGSADTVYVDQFVIRVTHAPEYRLACESGSYSIGGFDAAFSMSRKVNCGCGVYEIAIHAAPIVKAKTFVCASGVFEITGHDVAFTASRKINCESGVYAIAGADAAILHHRNWKCDAGEYTISLFAAPMRRTKLFVCNTGVYTITGRPAEFQTGEIVPSGSMYFYLS